MMRNIICNMIIIIFLGVYIAHGEIPTIPDWSTRSDDGGKLMFCEGGAISQLFYGLNDKQKFYSRILKFHGKIIAVIKNRTENGKFSKVWLWIQPGDVPNEYYTDSTLSQLVARLPGGPCDLIYFHTDK